MAPKPFRPGNRFGLLDELTLSDPPDPPPPPPKRNKPSNSLFSEFPSLPTKSIFKNPRFVHITPKDDSKPLTKISVFILKKLIDSISTHYEKISQLRDGSNLILTRDQNIADKFINSKVLDSVCPVNIKLHSNLNLSKGIAYAPCLINVSESEIISELKSQYVTDVYKFNKTMTNDKGKEETKPTGLMIFSFDLFKIPESIEIGWYKTKLSEYIPNPMRCRQCQRLGHTTKWCKSPASCVTCNFPLHEGINCTRTECANCSGPHPASSKNCLRYIQSKEVLELKTKNKCTLAEARRMQRERYQTHSTISTSLFSEKLKNPPPDTVKAPKPSTSSVQTINDNKTQHISLKANVTELQKNDSQQNQTTANTEHNKTNNEKIPNLDNEKSDSIVFTQNNPNDNTSHSPVNTQTPTTLPTSTRSNQNDSLQTITSSAQTQFHMNIDNDHDTY
ncbi:uncharacterized protein LOC129947870 [Eupeodes corollae]|uniref:uncharacterized protein LOC129947870 n=1 Tax=Eupeodes corollae TaxID=290404 RepID=UPI002491D530|nr:uncharacterized protein LOC129947870 [Eupeodes corollae]